MIGRQVNFFFTLKDEQTFFDFIKSQSDFIVTIKNLPIHSETQLWIKSSNSQIFMRDDFIERDRSEVIEYSRSRIDKSNKILESGRIWASMSYLNDNKDGFLKKGELFKKWYDSYARWIKKYGKLSKDKGYYIGEDAYRLYKQKMLIMKSGPKYEVQWD